MIKSWGKPSQIIKVLIPEKIDKNFLENLHRNVLHAKRETLIKGWLPRLLITGRDFSGHKYQASQIAKERGLIMIDIDHELIKYQQKKSNLPFSIHLFNEMAKSECMYNGWIIVAHPAMLQHLQILFEKLLVQPTKVIFIHTSQKECRRRTDGALNNQFAENFRNFGQFSEEDFARQMHRYNLHKRKFVEYFGGKRPNVLQMHINGNQAKHKITTLILASI